MPRRPQGALSEGDRLNLSAKAHGSKFTWTGRRGYYVVRNDNGRLILGGTSSGGDTTHQFSFDWDEHAAYYFDNYFHALAYSLRLKQYLSTGDPSCLK